MPNNKAQAVRDGHEYTIEILLVATVSGALDLNKVKNGKVILDASSALNVSLPVPRPGACNKDGDDGAELTIVSNSAFAHVITSATKFGTGATGTGTATLGGAVGDGIVLIAYQGKWLPKPGGNKNATLT